MELDRQGRDRELDEAADEARGVWEATRLAPELAENVCVLCVGPLFLIKQEHRAIRSHVRNAARK